MITAVLVSAMLGATLPDGGLIPLDSRSHYPHFLGFRPGDGQVVDCTPPRISWPYVQGTITTGHPTQRLFTLQIAPTDEFADPVVEVRDTPYNFYNALPVLEEGTWHWRVGYRLADEPLRWSDSRSFIVTEDAVEWDRTVIERAPQLLGAKAHPRLGPTDGDWEAFRATLEADEHAAEWLAEVLKIAENAGGRDWWTDFPETDRKDATGLDGADWAKIAWELANCALAYRLTRDESLLPGIDHVVALASFPKGGQSSPEYHADVRKWPTQVTEHLAVCYDLWHPELSEGQREQILASIGWRLHATYLEAASWLRSDGTAHVRGVAVFPASHPFENFVWSMPAALLTAGDLELSDELVPLTLNYLTGVTSGHGPDEGWNEGLAYGGWKGLSMLYAAMHTQLLLPELHLGRSPYFQRLGEWYAHILPLGIRRLSFGDYAQGPEGQRGTQLHIFKLLAWLTDDGRTTRRYHALAGEVGYRRSARPWLDLSAAARLQMPEPRPYSPSAVFPEAGWVMVSTAPPSDREAFEDATGMIFTCRPRGGYSHSFRAENDFVWYAHGQTLSVGAGGAYPDPHSRHSMSHNVIMVDGQGQDWNSRDPAYPYCGRLLAYREGDGYTWWVGDATHAYQNVPGLLRWHRHVVFLDGRAFVIFDDLAMREDADPAQFSWLLHVDQPVELSIDGRPCGSVFTEST
ncbi:MAG: DUF4962 domain-containing protein, partial [Armatimonadota bacterium]